VDAALAHLHEVKVPEQVPRPLTSYPSCPGGAAFVHDVLVRWLPATGLAAGERAAARGTSPTHRKWRSGICPDDPGVDEQLCIQCGKWCCLPARGDPPRFTTRRCWPGSGDLQSAKPKWKNMDQELYTLQWAGDCTGCSCASRSAGEEQERSKHKAINMEMQAPALEPEAKNWSSSSPA